MSDQTIKRVLPKLHAVFRVVLGAVFLYACWDKILKPEEFAEAIRNYQILPSVFIEPMALLLPWIELVCGISLIVNRWTRGAALVIALLMLIFMAALVINIIRGVDISCGCFTLTQKATASMWYYMLRDSLLLVMAMTVLFYRYPGSSSQAPAR